MKKRSQTSLLLALAMVAKARGECDELPIRPVKLARAISLERFHGDSTLVDSEFGRCD